MNAKNEIEPLDFERCQSEWLGGSFMTFGPRQRERCKKIPVWIAIEITDGKLYGAMSLCEECKIICKKLVPSASYIRIKRLLEAEK